MALAMFNMFDVFRQAQGGAAFDNLARAYGMAPEQLRAMTAALTPAFAQGFQRQASTDGGARRFAELFQTDAYARAFEAQAAALDPSARGAGEDALGALFGSKEVSRAVAAQAAAVSGVQAQIIREVLPVLASILMGGFVKAAQNAGPQGASAAAAVEGMFGARRPAGPDKPEPSPFAVNPFQMWMNAFAPKDAEPAKPEPEPEAPANPLGDMMGEMMKSMFGAAASEPPVEPRPEPAPEPKATPEPEARRGDAPAETPFDDLVATGRELSQQNAEAMSQIFDAFFGDKPKKA